VWTVPCRSDFEELDALAGDAEAEVNLITKVNRRTMFFNEGGEVFLIFCVSISFHAIQPPEDPALTRAGRYATIVQVGQAAGRSPRRVQRKSYAAVLTATLSAVEVGGGTASPFSRRLSTCNSIASRMS
jgi:hypothetical protein